MKIISFVLIYGIACAIWGYRLGWSAGRQGLINDVRTGGPLRRSGFWSKFNDVMGRLGDHR
jgi:hypothetical protein